jgi:hypothetical protein
MRRAIILLITLCLITAQSGVIFADQSLVNGCSSAGILNEPVWFNCDYDGVPGVGVYLSYMGQGDADFSRVAMSPVSEAPYYEFTYETNVSFTSNPGILEYYFSAELDTFMATQSPKNAGDQFPPPLYKYAHFVTDPTGDMAGGSAGSWLDLTGCGMTYSDSRLYCYLDNVTGTWPLNQVLDYFAYTFGFLTTSGADSAYYALVYTDIPILLSSGLYALDLIDSSYTRIGDIDYAINGGLLHMACDLTEFGSDPGWLGWPPPEGYIVPMAVTLSAGLSGQFANDMTYTAIYEPNTQYLDFNSNASPGLFSYSIEVDSNISLTPRIHYFDQDNNLPVVRYFYLDFSSYDMASYDHAYSDTSEFEATVNLPGDGRYYFYFQFSDGSDTVETALDSILIGSPGYAYLPGDANMYNAVWQPAVIGSDATYLINYFRGQPSSIPCLLDGFWASADANGDCQVIGSDVTKLVNYFRGSGNMDWCPAFEPAWHDASELPVEAPAGWPDCEE